MKRTHANFYCTRAELAARQKRAFIIPKFAPSFWKSCGLLMLCLISGCIYIPVIPKPANPEAPDLRTLIGGAGSQRPISPGVSKEQVLRLLGPPARRSVDGLSLAYGTRYIRGYWVGLILQIAREEDISDSIPKFRWYTVRLDFNSDQRLATYKMHENDVYPDELGGVDMGALDALLPEAGSETLIPGFEERLRWRAKLGRDR